MSTPSPVRPIRAKIVTSAPDHRIAAAPVTAPGRDVGEAAGRGSAHRERFRARAAVGCRSWTMPQEAVPRA